MGVIFTFLMGILFSFESITDNDYFWHVVIGKWIDVNKAIPSAPLFSWWGLKQGYSWTSHEWLTEWIMYKAGNIGCIIIMLTIFLLLYYIMFKMLKLNFKKLLDARLLYLLIMTVFFKVTGPRPYIISLLFFAYLIYVLFSYLDGEKKIFEKLIWTLPLMQILWANLHGGSSSMPYIFIIVVLLADFVLKIFKFKYDRLSDFLLNKKQQKTLIINLILILIATCINPVGYKLLIYPFTNMLDNNMLDYILEWESPSFHGLLGIYIFIMVAVPVFNMIFTKKKFKLYEIAIFGLFFYMALKSQRFIGMFGIYSTWMLGKYIFIDDIFYDIIRKPFRKCEKIITSIFAIFLIAVTGIVAYKQVSNFKIIDNHGYYSDEAIKTVVKLNPKRMYNDFGNGGYLLYKLDELNALNDTNIFIYGLGDVFSNNILPDANKLYYLKDDPVKLMDKYDFDIILTVSRSPLCQYLKHDENWEVAYADDMNYVFRKN